MMGQVLEPMKQREERKGLSPPRLEDRKKESNGKNWAGILKGYQRLGILGMHSTAEVGWRLLGRGATKYKKRRTYVSFSSTQWCSKEPENLESDNS